MSATKSLKQYFLEPLWSQNQVLQAVLGICSALGITISIQVAVTMGVAVIFVTGCSSFFVSLLRNHTPDSVRMITQLAVISLFVIVVDQFLRAYLFDLSKQLSVYVGLIITNCLVMGRAEAMAKNVPPIPAFLDGVGAGMGYAIVILIVAFFRETLGAGTLMGVPIIPEHWYATAQNPDAYQNMNLMLLPPAAFFIIGFMIMFFKRMNPEES